MKLFTLYMRQAPLGALAAIAIGILNGVISAWLIAIISGQLSNPAAVTWRNGAAFAGICLLRLATGIAAHWIMIRLSQRAICDLRQALADGILKAPLSQIERLGSARLTAFFGEDIPRVATVVINVPYFCINVITLIACLAYIGYLSLFLAGIVAGCTALGLLSYLLPVMIANRQLLHARAAEDTFFSHVRDLLAGIRELKQHPARREEFVKDRLRPTIQDLYRLNCRGVSIYAAAANWMRLLFFLMVGVLLLINSEYLAAPVDRLAAVVLTLLYVMAPVEAICNSLPHFARANIALHELARIGTVLIERAESFPIARPDNRRHFEQLHLKGISYEYEPADEKTAFRLGPIDLSLSRGRIVFLTGSNGGGKTTLAKVLAGLYLPQTGTLLLDDHPVTAADHEAYRARCAVLWSESFVFPTIPRALDARQQHRAAEMLQEWNMSDRVSLNRGHFSATTALSSGQQKRLALINATLADADIYVFDEWAANQDPQYTARFYRRYLRDLADQGKIILVISHDEHYFDIADRMLTLERGMLQSHPATVVAANSPIALEGAPYRAP
jgi:putative ATP-binding cassette transporter